ncbi:DUF1697 domain-containing protein [Deinococcus sonorensis]|uniref:DUF1697 domain-containing protein n=2 Tax=Deinococcus sonorensis TaxID=309891 RepID=A0AAU7U8Q4_9DEIO
MTAHLHVALLRGINVGGHRRVPMPALRTVFEAAGCTRVKTYLQSGNVVFQADGPDVDRLQAALLQAFGFAVDVVLRRADEWGAVRRHCPYLAQAAADPTTVHVAFLPEPPDPQRVTAVRARAGTAWEARGREVYLHLPDGLGHSDLNLAPLGPVVTVRNWRTVEAVGALLDQP